jgi:hypothetical protein
MYPDMSGRPLPEHFRCAIIVACELGLRAGYIEEFAVSVCVRSRR